MKKLELPPNRELEKILIRTRAGTLSTLLWIIPSAVMLIGLALIVMASFLSGGRLVDADTVTTRRLLSLSLFIGVYAGATILYRVYRTRMHSDDSIVLSAVHLAKYAGQGKRGAGWERLSPMMLQLAALERNLAIFFSQLAGGTDVETARQFRQ